MKDKPDQGHLSPASTSWSDRNQFLRASVGVTASRQQPLRDRAFWAPGKGDILAPGADLRRLGREASAACRDRVLNWRGARVRPPWRTRRPGIERGSRRSLGRSSWRKAGCLPPLKPNGYINERALWECPFCQPAQHPSLHQPVNREATAPPPEGLGLNAYPGTYQPGAPLEVVAMDPAAYLNALVFWQPEALQQSVCATPVLSTQSIQSAYEGPQVRMMCKESRRRLLFWSLILFLCAAGALLGVALRARAQGGGQTVPEALHRVKLTLAEIGVTLEGEVDTWYVKSPSQRESLKRRSRLVLEEFVRPRGLPPFGGPPTLVQVLRVYAPADGAPVAPAPPRGETSVRIQRASFEYALYPTEGEASAALAAYARYSGDPVAVSAEELRAAGADEMYGRPEEGRNNMRRGRKGRVVFSFSGARTEAQRLAWARAIVSRVVAAGLARP